MIRVSIEFEITKENYMRFKHSNIGFEPKSEFIFRNKDLINELCPDRFNGMIITDFTLFSDSDYHISIEGEL